MLSSPAPSTGTFPLSLYLKLELQVTDVLVLSLHRFEVLLTDLVLLGSQIISHHSTGVWSFEDIDTGNDYSLHSAQATANFLLDTKTVSPELQLGWKHINRGSYLRCCKARHPPEQVRPTCIHIDQLPAQDFRRLIDRAHTDKSLCFPNYVLVWI